jgi:hypothetical protein
MVVDLDKLMAELCILQCAVLRTVTEGIQTVLPLCIYCPYEKGIALIQRKIILYTLTYVNLSHVCS